MVAVPDLGIEIRILTTRYDIVLPAPSTINPAWVSNNPEAARGSMILVPCLFAELDGDNLWIYGFTGSGPFTVEGETIPAAATLYDGLAMSRTIAIHTPDNYTVTGGGITAINIPEGGINRHDYQFYIWNPILGDDTIDNSFYSAAGNQIVELTQSYNPYFTANSSGNFRFGNNEGNPSISTTINYQSSADFTGIFTYSNPLFGVKTEITFTPPLADFTPLAFLSDPTTGTNGFSFMLGFNTDGDFGVYRPTNPNTGVFTTIELTGGPDSAYFATRNASHCFNYLIDPMTDGWAACITVHNTRILYIMVDLSGWGYIDIEAGDFDAQQFIDTETAIFFPNSYVDGRIWVIGGQWE